jgi:hypothetical protein
MTIAAPAVKSKQSRQTASLIRLGRLKRTLDIASCAAQQ